MLDQSWLTIGTEPTEQDRLFLKLKSATACSEDELRAILARSSWCRWHPEVDGIRAAVISLSTLLATGEQPKPDDRYCIAIRHDADVKVVVDKDKMNALAHITADWGGKSLTMELLQEAMRLAGVTVGLSPELEHQALRVSLNSAPGTVLQYPVAVGKPAIDGTDAILEPLVETLTERVLKPRQLDHDRVDLRDLGTLSTVDAGTPLMRRHPATPGEAGVNVLGVPIQPKAGKEISLNAGSGTLICAEDGNLLLSQRSGMPRLEKNGMVVDDLLNLKTVDAKHGHVEFNGSLVISGDVEPGMKVKASGDIVIGGFVEAATVAAGGSVTIKQGVVGRRTSHGEPTCVVRANLDVTVSFAQYARLEAEQDIKVQNQLSHCYCRAGRHVLVGESNPRKGVLLGGLTIAGESIESPFIGTEATSHTQLQVLGGFFAIRSQQRDLNEQKAQHTLMLHKLQDLLLKLVQQPASKRDAVLLNQLKEQREHHMQALGQINQELEECDALTQSILHNIHITATQRLYPGALIELADLAYKVDIEHGPSRIGISDGQIELHPWSAPPNGRKS